MRCNAKPVFPTCPGDYDWTTWFNIDHPGGKGDYEQLDAIRFYYRARVCESPRALEARTTDWIPARRTGERVHAEPAVGFWCINSEQPEGKSCSNYAVRFLCPRGKVLRNGFCWLMTNLEPSRKTAVHSVLGLFHKCWNSSQTNKKSKVSSLAFGWSGNVGFLINTRCWKCFPQWRSKNLMFQCFI